MLIPWFYRLVTQLMKSNKSDTWYLMTARTFLLVVLVWLVWRRLLWGPTWWLLWMPLKIMYTTLMAIMGPFGVSSDVGEPGAGTSSLRIMPSASERPPAFAERQAPYIQVGRGGGGGGVPPAKDPSKHGSLSQKIGRMVEEAEKIVRGDGAVLKDSDEPRNPKKRVLDTAGEGLRASDIIDELEQEEQPAADEANVDGRVRDEL
jgi:protein transport protein SEC20